MKIITSTAKGRVVIPADIRKRHRIVKGTKRAIFEKGNEIIIRPLLREPIRNVRGLYKSALQGLLTSSPA